MALTTTVPRAGGTSFGLYTQLMPLYAIARATAAPDISSAAAAQPAEGQEDYVPPDITTSNLAEQGL